MIAFGYVRLDGDDDAAFEASRDLVTVAMTEGYDVKEVYVDRQAPPDSIVRRGFQALVERLERDGVAYVLVPDLDHLSPFPTVRTALVAKLASLGATAVPCEPAVPEPPVS